MLLSHVSRAPKRRTGDSDTYCWKVTQCEDTQQTCLAARSIPDNHQLPAVSIQLATVFDISFGFPVTRITPPYHPSNRMTVVRI